MLFYTITNLQGSQTLTEMKFTVISFTPLQTYKVLKQLRLFNLESKCFTPLQTYKVLKLRRSGLILKRSFTPLQTYKVLKLELR